MIVIPATNLPVREEVLSRCLAEAERRIRTLDRKRRHFSFAVRKGRIIALGQNIPRTHTMPRSLGYRGDWPHSELDLLIRMGEERDCTLVNISLNLKRGLRMSKPCPICSSWIPDVFNHCLFTTAEGWNLLF